MQKFDRFVDGMRVRWTRKQKNGKILVMLESTKGQRGKLRIFENGAAYERAVVQVPTEDRKRSL